MQSPPFTAGGSSAAAIAVPATDGTSAFVRASADAAPPATETDAAKSRSYWGERQQQFAPPPPPRARATPRAAPMRARHDATRHHKTPRPNPRSREQRRRRRDHQIAVSNRAARSCEAATASRVRHASLRRHAPSSQRRRALRRRALLLHNALSFSHSDLARPLLIANAAPLATLSTPRLAISEEGQRSSSANGCCSRGRAS